MFREKELIIRPAFVSRTITSVQYWDIYDFGQGKAPWDRGSWHHAVMGVALETDQGPVTVTWTNRFHPYGIEVFDEPVERHLRLGPEGPEPNGPEGATPWSRLLGRVCRAVKVTWWVLGLGPATTSDGTEVAPARAVDVPVAIRLDLDDESVWLVAAIPGPDGLPGAFVGGDEIVIVFEPTHARALGVE